MQLDIEPERGAAKKASGIGGCCRYLKQLPTELERMSTLSPRRLAAIGALGASLVLLPTAVAAADTPPTGLLPSQVNPVQQALGSLTQTPVVNQALMIYSNLAGDAGGAAWGALDLITVGTQIPRSPADSTPIQLSANYNQLVNSSTSAASGAAAQGTGRLEVVGTRVAKDGRSVRVKVTCVGGSAGCDGTLRLKRRSHHHAVVMTQRVRLASGATRKYTLHG